MRQRLTQGENERFGKRSEPALAPSIRLSGEENRGCSTQLGFEVGAQPLPSELSSLQAAGPGRVAANPMCTCVCLERGTSGTGSPAQTLC